MRSVLFFDPACRQPYDTATRQHQAIGGTEASVTRIADALGAYVMQHNRATRSGQYLPPGRIPGIRQVVVVRDSRCIAQLREWYSGAQFYLWLHDQVNPGSMRGRWLRDSVKSPHEQFGNVICVSDWQRSRIEATLRWLKMADSVRATTIYNPVDDTLIPDETRIDPFKLVFFSSPNKGLPYALDVFRALRRRMPGLRLVVGNPGYKIMQIPSTEGIRYVGPQPQARIHAEVRGALCTFVPNFLLPETFGLVYAESKALGTPVLTHDCGSAVEVIGDPEQILPVRLSCRIYESLVHRFPLAWRRGPARLADRIGLFEAYIERIRSWQDGGRPRVQPDSRFLLSQVTNQWRSLLQR